MRGKLTAFDGQPIELGITPADAGKTRHQSVSSSFLQDHPRGCGENGNFKVALARKRGSPPRMRGKPPQSRFSLPCCGITPADAGKTFRIMEAQIDTEDHPRGCGENVCLRWGRCCLIGSPPRMRGKQDAKVNAKGFLRITPADAGKT